MHEYAFPAEVRSFMALHSNKQSNSRYSTIFCQTGFTLIELMVTIAIIAILAAIVVPSYNAQMHKTRRSDAQTALMQIAQSLERCRSDTNAYDDAACTVPTLSDQKYYDISISRDTTTYTITAAAKTGTPQENDTLCKTFTLDNTGLKKAKDKDANDTSNDCWP